MIWPKQRFVDPRKCLIYTFDKVLDQAQCKEAETRLKEELGARKAVVNFTFVGREYTVAVAAVQD